MNNYHPTLYQINTRVWLTERCTRLGRNVTLDDIPDKQLDGLQRLGFDWIYLLGVWPDTLQLNYGNPALQEAMRGELLEAAKLCDGLRCDMAMLVLPEVFKHTWGIESEPFWPEAISRVREEKPGFVFMAEVYWDMEWTLQQQGFDHTYDKRLYDRLRGRHAHSVREHFRAEADYQNRSARFLENHDEPRAATIFPGGVHQAAALLTFLCPGLRFFHHGQLGGWERKIPIHLCRGPVQQNDSTLQEFYGQLLEFLSLPAVRSGSWQLLDCGAASDGNPAVEDMIAFAWQGSDDARALIVVNYAPQPGQCFVRLPFADYEGQPIRLEGRLGTPDYERDGSSLMIEGLYVDLPAWGYHVFEVHID